MDGAAATILLRPTVEGAIPARLGRFLVGEKLGEGGMGIVYRGEDIADGTTVAIKVLRGAWVERPDAIKRFTKEARILATIKTPYVVNYIELNEDDGVHYLVLEYVQGRTLRAWLTAGARFEEKTALTIIADVARGLSVAHERGIIHRDIKPDNILLVDGVLRTESEHGTVDPSSVVASSAPGAPMQVQVKLSDFGLARHTEETESLLLTQTGAILGTPLYMAPEQSMGTEAVGPAADVYSLGATLFHLLAGRPPFLGTSAFDLIARLRSEPAPGVRTLNSAVSEGAAQVVAKALVKRPEERYRDAGEMLQDLDRLLRGEPTSLVAHPARPACDPRDLVAFTFRWELESAPRQLWPSVSNTERLNRALGLPAVSFRNEPDPAGGVKRFGQFQTAGLEVSWREHPFEWVEGQRMGVVREFTRGPFRWFVSIVELTPRGDGGTTLEHTVLIAAKGLFGRLMANLKIGRQGRRSMDRVYRRIDAALAGKMGRDPLTDPFEPPPPLRGNRPAGSNAGSRRWDTMGSTRSSPRRWATSSRWRRRKTSRGSAPWPWHAGWRSSPTRSSPLACTGRTTVRSSCSGTSSARSAASRRSLSARWPSSARTATATPASSTTSSTSAARSS